MPFLLLVSILGVTGLVITEPVEGQTYTGDWLSIRAIVENDNMVPDSVVCVLNGGAPALVPRLSTDWYTYMANNEHTGFSRSPAPLDATVLWTAPVTGDTHEFCSPVVVNGIVYFVSDEQSIAYALDAATGTILWQYDVNDHVDDAVTFYEGNVYIAADSAWCLDAVTGQRVWAFKPGPGFKMNGTPALGDGVAYFTHVPDWSNVQVFALDAFTGEVLWSVQHPGYTTGCLTLHDGVLYLPTYNGSLYALDAGTGQTLWTNSDASSGYWDSSPVYVDGILYICGHDGIVRGISASTGITEWERDLTAGVRYIAATPAFAYERLFFADQVDSFHCLSALDGSTVWSAAGVQHGSTGIADNVAFFGQGADRANGQVRALDCSSGQVIWSYQTGGTEVFSSPAITDGVMYIAGMDWNLYAFGTGLMFTYLDDLFAQVGENTVVVTSYAGGEAVAADTVDFTVTGTGISLEPGRRFQLAASPNPFAASATVSFRLSEPGYSSLAVFDLSGRMVTGLFEGTLPAGEHSFPWDGRSSDGETAPTGLYICRLESGGVLETMGMCLLRK